MDSKVTEVEKTVTMLETKLSDAQAIYCRRDEELMSAHDMQKELWQNLREELQKELKLLQTDMNQLVPQKKGSARDERMPTPAKNPKTLDIGFARVQATNMFKSGKDTSHRTAPKNEQGSAGLQEKDEHQKQTQISRQDKV